MCDKCVKNEVEKVVCIFKKMYIIIIQYPSLQCVILIHTHTKDIQNCGLVDAMDCSISQIRGTLCPIYLFVYFSECLS